MGGLQRAGTDVSPVPLSTSGPEAFFLSAHQAFELSARTAGAEQRFFKIGNQIICLQFAGKAMVSGLTRALAHLAIDPTVPDHKPDNTPDLTICIWDSQSTGVAMPPPPWNADAYEARGQISSFWTQEINTAYYMGNGTLNMLHLGERTALYWLYDADDLNVYDRAMPLRNLLEWWMLAQDHYILHCAAVGTVTGGLLLAGLGGAGKSNTAISCLLGGLGYLGDDQCLVGLAPEPMVYSLYNTGRVLKEDLSRLMGLPAADGLYPSGDEIKLLHYFCGTYSSALVAAAPLRAIVMPKVTGRKEAQLSSISPHEVFMGLSPVSMPHDLARRRQLIEATARMPRLLPSYRLELSTTPALNVDCLRQLLQRLEAA